MGFMSAMKANKAHRLQQAGRREEAEKLYEAAGYVLTETNKFDLCVRYFLNARKYNVVEDNIILDEYGLPLMGARA